MKDLSRSARLASGLNTVVLMLIALSMVFPFVYIFAVSFSSLKDVIQSDLLLWPKEWVTDAYQYILSSDAFIRSFGVTVTITVIGTLVNILFTSTMAYGLSRPIRGQRVMLFLVVFTLLFNAGMIPTYMVVKATGLIDSLWSLILPIAINPFNLIVMRQFFLHIPEELHEAAIIDGANHLQIFSRIMLPLSKPAIAAFSLFYAVLHWNSYFHAILYINDPAKWPLQVVLRQIVIVDEPDAALGGAQRMLENPPPPETVQMAAILLATLPILLVYPFLQKYFVKGVMLGSVKE
ncbi:MAG: carbohydrate ABC transporter permease [Firmicutes bacterium]|uniref:Carbohydrate ABC transporter membrane protein 2, CUT1 family n=1 Tax=Melghirimyces thermohalophilus TaxID=1236220 RepID=A0A1G6P7L4_9BACL|nr:carbohydrate ABC transporter permease [Melghirimyces thermohalophilus]MDA8354665.1 carbohydrate ABC transporter permease [Bacillota bacterium]SDC75486.1 carbohydrate ABC transporter membrane protein 2, CUT1 family [Melghirimyces thermohalophilus]